MRRTMWTALLIVSLLLVSLPTLADEATPLARPHQGVSPQLPGERIALDLSGQPASAQSGSRSQAVQADVNLELDDGTIEGSIGIGGTLEFLYLNRFTPDPSDFAFTLDEIQVYFESDTQSAQVGDDIILVVYENTSGSTDPAVGANWLASYPTTVQSLNAWNVYTLSTPVTFQGPGDVLIGVIAMEKPGSAYYPAAEDQTASLQRSWAGWWPSTPPDPPTLPPTQSWTLIDNAGASLAGNWMIRGYGTHGTPVPRVLLDPQTQTGRGEANDTIPYQITLRNLTGQTDSFDVTYSSNTWTVNGPDEILTVAQGDTRSFQVDVTIASDASCPECETVEVKAVAQASPTLSDTVTIETCLGQDWQTESNTGAAGSHWLASTCTDEEGALGQCFYVGGLGAGNALTGYAQRYDIASGTWSRIADLPTPVFGGVAGYINGKVYVAAGFSGTTSPWPVTGALQIYDVASNTWSSGPAMPVPRGGAAGGVVGNKLYVAAGYDQSYDYRYLHEFDPATNAWTEKAGVPAFMGFGAGTGGTDHLYVGGGYGGENKFFAYDSTADTWEQESSLPGGAGKKSPVMAFAPNCGGVFLYGGDLGEWNDVQDSTWYWHPLTGTWMDYGTTLNQSTTGGGGGWANGKLWAFGGSLGSGPTLPPPHESLAYCCPAGPPAGLVAGYITDANTGQPLENAGVLLTMPGDVEYEVSRRTNAQGYYSFGPLLVDQYRLRAAAMGYESALSTFTLVDGTTLVRNFALNAAIPEVSRTAVGLSLPAASTQTYTVTLSNSGTFSLTYHTSELPADALTSRTTKAPSGVDPELYETLSTSAAGTGRFIVYLAEQADLSEAFNIQDRSARGYYVLNQLRATAKRTQAGLRAELDEAGVRYTPRYIVNAVEVEGNLNLVQAMAARPEVAYVSANQEMPAPEPVQSQPSAEGIQALAWGVDKVRSDDVWTTFGAEGGGIIVANIDTGVDHDHNALVNQYRGTAGAGVYDHNYNWWDPYGYGPNVPYDFHSHGSHTMGTMVGYDGGTNQIGMAPDATWFTCQGFDQNTGSGYEAELLECAEFVLAPWDLSGANPDPDLRADVVNNSWGGGQGQWWYNQMIYAWRAAGIFPAFSAGNDGSACGTAGDPGDMPNVMAVGATDTNDSNAPGSVADFSSRGPAAVTGLTKPDVSAPGANIWSAYNNGSYGSMSGTSMASPHVAGLAALIWSAQPALRGNVDLTYDLIKETAVPLVVDQGYYCGTDDASNVPNNQYGWGRIDAYAAVQTALTTDWDLEWIAVDPVSGTIPPGGSQEIALHFDSTGLTSGSCANGHLRVEFNDPYVQEVYIKAAACVDYCLGLDQVTISAPPWEFVEHDITFSAIAVPVTASLPISIEWSNGATDTIAVYNWGTTGTYTVVVTATNCLVPVTDTVQIDILPNYPVYLPTIQKSY